MHSRSIRITLVMALAVVASLAGPVGAFGAGAESTSLSAGTQPATSRPAAPVALLGPDASTCVANPVQLINSSFEDPVISSSPTFSARNQSTVPGWSTTEPDHLIEFWANSFQGIPAAQGTQFVELNANAPGTLFQTVVSVPGSTLTWTLNHRGRHGVDTMAVVAGPPGGPYTQVAQYADGNTAWSSHVGSYTVPANQTVTLFGFQAVSTSGGNLTEGNFLDDITFGSAPCITATKTVAASAPTLSAPFGSLRYTIALKNAGGDTATAVRLSDVVPANTAYVPGSMAQLSGPAAGPMTDAADADGGTFDSGTGTIEFSPGSDGTGALGVIRPNETIAVAFTVKALTGAAGTTISNQATGTYSDGLGLAGQYASNIVDVTIPSGADISVAITPAPVVVAPTATTTITTSVTNNGPQGDTGVVVQDTLPAGLTFVSSPDGCTAVGQVVTCPIGSLAAGATAAPTFIAQVDATPPGSVLTVTAAAAGSLIDPILTNNRAQAAVLTQLPILADLTTTASADAVSVDAGTSTGFAIGVVNAGQNDAAGSTLTATLTGPLTNVSGTLVRNGIPAGACTVVGTTATCDLGTVTNTDAIELRFSGDVPADAAVGSTIEVTSSVATTSPEFSITNNSATAQTEVTASADLALHKSAGSVDAGAGTVSMTVLVTNNGPSLATGVVVTDTLPAGQTVDILPPECSVAGSVMTCAEPNLAVGSSITINYRVVVDPALGQSNTASVTAATPDPDLSNNSETVDLITDIKTDLVLGVSQTSQTVAVGSPLTFTITITNAGPVPDHMVRAGWRPPHGVSVTSVNPSVGSVANGIWTVGDMAVGDVVTLTVTGVAQTEGDFTFPILTLGNRPELVKENNIAIPELIIVAAPPSPPPTTPPTAPPTAPPTTPPSTPGATPRFAPPANLSNTGADGVVPLLLAGLGAAAAGLVVLGVRRRRAR